MWGGGGDGQSQGLPGRTQSSNDSVHPKHIKKIAGQLFKDLILNILQSQVSDKFISSTLLTGIKVITLIIYMFKYISCT